MKLFRSPRLEERALGLQKIEHLKTNRSKTLIVHYSCESFRNTNGRTPRITSIAIKNRGNSESVVFSIHLTAQILEKSLIALSDSDFDIIEKATLKDFYDFVKKHATYRWVHWRMRTAVFGFEAIANRYRILKGNAISIEDEFKYNLQEVFSLIYTNDFEEEGAPTKGQLLNLSIRNNITNTNAITGEEEAKAFDDRDFLKLHMSSMRKVELIDRLLNLEEYDRLKVATTMRKIYGITPQGIAEIIRNNWFLLAFWSVMMAVLGMAMEPVVQRFFGTSL